MKINRQVGMRSLFCVFLVSISLLCGCLAKDSPDSPSTISYAYNAIPTASPTVSVVNTTVTEKTNTKLFNLSEKSTESLFEDFSTNKELYHGFNVPKPDTTVNPEFSEKDIVLARLSGKMSSVYEKVLYMNPDNDPNYNRNARLWIVTYYYCKYLFDCVANNKMLPDDANDEMVNISSISYLLSIDEISKISEMIDSGDTFAMIRDRFPEWFVDNNALPATKSPKS